MIALLCPTRGRPEQFKRMVQSVINTSTYGDVIIYYAMQEDDKSDYSNSFPKPQKHFVGYAPLAIYSESMPTVQKWNDTAVDAMKYNDNGKKIKLFMLASDDIIFSTPGWDKALLDHYNALENKIHCYALQDSRDENGTPHVIVTREWIEVMGWFVPPYFLHFYPDTWSVEIAKTNNCFTHLRNYLLVHDKSNDRGKPDQTHLRIRNMGWSQRDTYVDSACHYILEFEKERLARVMK